MIGGAGARDDSWTGLILVRQIVKEKSASYLGYYRHTGPWILRVTRNPQRLFFKTRPTRSPIFLRCSISLVLIFMLKRVSTATKMLRLVNQFPPFDIVGRRFWL